MANQSHILITGKPTEGTKKQKRYAWTSWDTIPDNKKTHLAKSLMEEFSLIWGEVQFIDRDLRTGQVSIVIYRITPSSIREVFRCG